MKKTNKMMNWVRKNRIKVTAVICAIFAIIVATNILIKTVAYNSMTPEERLLADASREDHRYSTDETVENFTLEENSFSINGEKYFYMPEILQKLKTREIPIVNHVELPENVVKNFKKAKKLIKEFAVGYFKKQEADKITKALKDLPIVVGDFDAVQLSASFCYENDKVYAGVSNISFYTAIPDDDMLQTMTHELLHFVKEKVSESQEGLGIKFDEGMTDVIAVAICQADRLDGGYRDYRPYAYMFLNAFGEKAIHAYFFGYDEFDSQKMKVLEYLTEVSGTDALSDGLSDADAYCRMSEKLDSVNDLYALGKEIIMSMKAQ